MNSGKITQIKWKCLILTWVLLPRSSRGEGLLGWCRYSKSSCICYSFKTSFELLKIPKSDRNEKRNFTSFFFTVFSEQISPLIIHSGDDSLEGNTKTSAANVVTLSVFRSACWDSTRASPLQRCWNRTYSFSKLSQLNSHVWFHLQWWFLNALFCT